MANDQSHFVSGVIHHQVHTHLCLGLGSSTDVRLELCFERHLHNPTIGSFLLEDAIQKSLNWILLVATVTHLKPLVFDSS